MMMWEMSKFRLSQCFLPVPLSEVCNKKKHHHSLTLTGFHSPFPLLQDMLIQDYFGPLLTCCLMFPLFLWLANIQPSWNCRHSWEREARTWHPRHPDESLLRVWHYKSFIKWENAVFCTSNRAALHKLKRTWQLGCLREKEHVLS